MVSIEWCLNQGKGIKLVEPNKNISEYKVLTGYKKIDDKRLSYLRSLYNFQYVISENTFPLNLKIVYRNELYTLYEI